MNTPLRIKGNPGSDPLPDQPVPQTPPVRSVATLQIESNDLFVEYRGEKIPVDSASAKRVLGSWYAFRPAQTSRVQVPPDLRRAIEVARNARAELSKPGVISVRGGYQFSEGRITRYPCIVVEVDPSVARPIIPPVVDGIPVEVTPADPYQVLSHREGAEAVPFGPDRRLLIDDLQRHDEVSQEIARTITYEPPPGASLPEVSEAMAITCHVSPDAGWAVLEPFLKATQDHFVLGMYDFTAPHIFQAARSLLRDSDVSWDQTLGPNESLPGPGQVDSTKANDLTEESIVTGLKRVARSRFNSAFARIGSGKTFASAYHIKVGVRDHSAFWLSSGNWQSSNQPDIDFLSADADRQLIPKYNREWHVVIENRRLSGIFETYLNGDFKTASEQAEAGVLPEAVPQLPSLMVPEDEFLFEERAGANLQVFAPRRFVFTKERPLRLQPILSPDNYVGVVLDLLRRKPCRTLYFQNQSLNPVKQPTPEFEELMQLLADYSNDKSLDVRMVFRNIGPVRKKLESLQAAGFNMDRIRMQAGCHTKGIIVDSEVILLGSHNFTNDGVQFNRDASLLVFDSDIAHYYQDVFLHDWERLARVTVRPESAVLANLTEGAPVGFVRVPWSYYDDPD